MKETETHREIREHDIIERYVLNKLPADERRAFQEHYFECDECFEEAQVAARFAAGVREASSLGLLAADPSERIPGRGQNIPIPLVRRWGGVWLVPALAASLLIAVSLAGLWGLSLRRDKQQLAELKSEQSRVSEQIQRLDAKISELESSDSALQEQKKSLSEENERLKEQIATTERQLDGQVAQLNQLDINVPIRNIYPTGDAQRSTGASEINRIRVPRGTRTFVLILGDYKPGYSGYRLEIMDSAGRLIATREGLKPDQGGELSVMLSRKLISSGKYRLRLLGGSQPVAEYQIQVD